MNHPTNPDELEPLSDKELGDLLELAHPKLDAFAQEAPGKAVLIRRLVAEVRRLRQLVIAAEPYVRDNEQTRATGLAARLKAEVDRK
jgi:hypothetical protein